MSELKTVQVRKVNAWIEEFNKKETGEQLNLHLYGVKGNPDKEPLVHKYVYFLHKSTTLFVFCHLFFRTYYS